MKPRKPRGMLTGRRPATSLPLRLARSVRRDALAAVALDAQFDRIFDILAPEIDRLAWDELADLFCKNGPYLRDWSKNDRARRDLIFEICHPQDAPVFLQIGDGVPFCIGDAGTLLDAGDPFPLGNDYLRMLADARHQLVRPLPYWLDNAVLRVGNAGAGQ